MRWKMAILTLCLCLGTAGTAWAQTDANAAMNSVNAMSVDEQSDGTLIRISGTKVPTFSVFKLNEPLRLFIDISNATLGSEPETKKIENGVISQVSLLSFEDNLQSMTRVIIGFDQSAHYDVRTEGQDVVVFVDGEKRRAKGGQVAHLTQTLEKRNADLEQREQRLRQAEERYRAETQRADSARARLSETESELKSLRSKLASATGAEKARVEKAIQDKNTAIDRMRAEVAKQQNELQDMRASVARLESERAELRQRTQRVESERDRALELAQTKQREGDQARQRAERLEAQLRAARAELKDVSQVSSSLKAQLASVNGRVDQTNRQVERAQSELRAAREREERLERRLTQLRSREAQGDSSATEEIARIRAEQSETRDQLDAREKALRVAQSDAQDARRALASTREKLSDRDAEVSRLQTELESVRQQASSAESERVAALERALAEERARSGEQRSSEVRAIEDELARARTEIEKLRSQQRERRAETGIAARAVPLDPASNEVRGIRLETTRDRSRIVVELTRPGNFETLPWKDSRAVMILNNVKLPKELEKTLRSQGESGAVRFVSSFKDNQGRVHLEAELQEDATEIVRQNGNELVWEFASTGGVQKVADASTEQSRPDDPSFTSAPPGYATVVTDPTRVSRVPGMSRKRITIDLRSADIQNVLRLLAKEGGVNIVAGDDVGGSVTVRLRSVPLDEVFLTVLQARSLGFEKRGNVIRVAPQSKLLTEQNQRAEARAAAAKSKPLEVFLVPVNYADAKAMQTQVQGVLGPRGTVTIDERTNTLVIKDIAENLAAMRSLIESLDTQVPQVLIEARIVETNDTFSQQLGIQWGGDVTFSQANGNPTGLVFPGVVGLAGGSTDGQTPLEGVSTNPNFAVNLPAPAGTGEGGSLGLTLGSVGGALNINLRLSAAESSGHAQIISSPKILTLNNSQATISQGTSIPISVVSAAGVQTVFVDATLELSVTPHVTPDGNIQMEISATKNEPDFQNTGARGDPTIIQRQAQTSLLIKDGDTTVIGGIYTRNSGTSLTAVPFFHKIPILGWFFKSTSQSERRTELLIFITPKIVNRAESIGNSTASN